MLRLKCVSDQPAPSPRGSVQSGTLTITHFWTASMIYHSYLSAYMLGNCPRPFQRKARGHSICPSVHLYITLQVVGILCM